MAILITGLSYSCSKEIAGDSYNLLELNFRSHMDHPDTTEIQLSMIKGDSFYDYTILYLLDSIDYQFKINKNDSNYIFLKKSFDLDGKQVSVTRIDNQKIASKDGRAYYYFADDRLFCIKSRDWRNHSFYLDPNREAWDWNLMSAFNQDTSGFFLQAIPKPTVRVAEPVPVDSTLRLDPDNPNLPDWVRILYTSDSASSDKLLLAWQPLNDSISFSVLEAEDSACSVFQISIIKNQKKLNLIPLGRTCEPDSFYWVWNEYEVHMSGAITVFEYKECLEPTDSSVQIPCIPGVDSTQRSFRITQEGNLIKAD